jgi:hypothetical protein
MGALTLMVSTPGQTQIETAKAPAPTLHCSSQVSDAPGKGILPMISGHMAAGLSLYHLDAQPIEQVSPLIQRQYLHGPPASSPRIGEITVVTEKPIIILCPYP